MEKASSTSNFQRIWAIALIVAGAGVFYRIPRVMPEIAKIDQFSGTIWVIRACFYIVGIVLIGGGIRKLLKKQPLSDPSHESKIPGT